MNKYICVHGHFYQPPRENAWLEEIEIQESAAPYHNWNDRITSECYHPNAFSRILNEAGKITDISNNYARISFNFGPTLLSYLEKFHPNTYNQILAADLESMELFGGHGSAMAQVYNHIIMPLASKRDKQTQVRWGLYDFEQRFKRKAEGIWLAETAVDTETLEVLADEGLLFTVLAPNQAKQFRALGTETWTSGIDTRRAYVCNLPSGKKIHLFFYDGDRSQGIAFKGLLNDGKRFAEELLSGFDEHAEHSQLVHVATDGESYGHHHKNGDMALAYCLKYIEDSQRAKICNYSQFLHLAEVTHEVEIHENSSWSCAHGIERWRSNCGCKTGGAEHWTQEWRKPLREALEWLQQEFDAVFEREMLSYHPNPWLVRDGYIEVLFQRNETTKAAFFKKYFAEKLPPAKRTRITRLLESQKHALYMYTSCGWFFTELSGIETVQILQYANRGIQLLESETQVQLNQRFKELLQQSQSNIPEQENGAKIYERYVEPKRLSLSQVGFHYAVNSLFAEDEAALSVLNYDCTHEDLVRHKAGNVVLALGRVRVRSKVTGSRKKLSFGILYLGNHHLIGSIGTYMLEPEFQIFATEASAAFEASNIALVNDVLWKHLTGAKFSFFDLYKEEQLKMLNGVISKNTVTAMASYKRIYERNYALMNLMRGQQLHIPQLLMKNLEVVVTYELEQLFLPSAQLIPIVKLNEQVEELRKWDIPFNSEKFNFLISKKLFEMVRAAPQNADVLPLIENLYQTLLALGKIGLTPDYSGVQNYVFQLIRANNLESKLKSAAFKLAQYMGLELA